MFLNLLYIFGRTRVRLSKSCHYTLIRLRVVPCFSPGDRRDRASRKPKWRMTERAKTGARTKKARWRRGEGEKRERKEGNTDNSLFKNLCGRCRPHYSDWSVLAPRTLALEVVFNGQDQPPPRATLISGTTQSPHSSFCLCLINHR